MVVVRDSSNRSNPKASLAFYENAKGWGLKLSKVASEFVEEGCSSRVDR